ncbi:hypothetical protein N7452_003044 [Penicillium brevicompactum]|uniref:CCHC-type domain-containing protein n=1 Tax=Penicillium brevicompactum TaxID=5074 RepID=A0A9W9UM40_PENBR|nr:hypothetical protein N7452_003044 [Penicillium brevicompactum]
MDEWVDPPRGRENTRAFDAADDGFACGNCGESGHMTRQCPNDSVPLRSKGNNSYGASYGDESGAGYGGGGDDRACFNCGQEGHSKADCPEPRKMGACFNCGEEGHSKADCTQPRVFKGTCRICEKEGHPAAECPERPPDICKNCLGEGHKTIECTENRKFDLNHVADMLPVEAWAAMKKASDERDLDDFREALKIYSKSSPEETFADIEKKMREEAFKIHIIALEKEVDDVMSLIDLQGKLDREYVVGLYFSGKASRGKLRERWPSDPDENLERLANAGFPFDRKIPKCLNCGELGHIRKSCKEERAEIEDRVEIKCSNCEEVGHRVRDCKVKRKYKHGCRNCGSGDHLAADCTEPRSAEGVECRKCNEQGHYAKDCPNVADRGPRACHNCGSEDHMARDCDQPRVMTCRNCDQPGHVARDCPEPKDWSKVKCNNCGEMGHTIKRCRQPVAEKEEEADQPSFSPAGSPSSRSCR